VTTVTKGTLMIMNYIPLIFATVAMLAVFAFAAEASS
jgi:hypothetical protein